MSLTVHTLKSNIVLRHVDTTQDERSQQILSWRRYLDHFLEVSVSRQQVESGYIGKINRYSINQMVYIEAISQAHSFGRSIARISKDNLSFFCFYLIMDGSLGSVEGLFKQNAWGIGQGRCLLALDMGQTFNLYQPNCKMQAFFIPRAMVEAEFPDPESLHGRVIRDSTPLTNMIFDHLASLIKEIEEMGLNEAEQALLMAFRLILATFGKQAKLTGNARAALRSVMFTQAKRHIEKRLDDETLSAESILSSLQLPRATLYRLFEHEGGIDAYIRNRRLRAAAFDLVKHPSLTITEVAYSLGFKKLPDFTRAFKRAYDLSPSDLRVSSQHIILPRVFRELEPMFNQDRKIIV